MKKKSAERWTTNKKTKVQKYKIQKHYYYIILDQLYNENANNEEKLHHQATKIPWTLGAQ